MKTSAHSSGHNFFELDVWIMGNGTATTLFGFGFLYDLDLDGTEIDDILQHTKNRNRTRYVLTKRGKNTEGPFLFYSLLMHQSLSLSLSFSHYTIKCVLNISLQQRHLLLLQ